MSNDLLTTFEELLGPNALGFGHVMKRIHDTGAGGAFPPYNIIKNGDGFRIEIAIAGYDPSTIDIEFKDGILTVKGDHQVENEDSGEEYVVKNIAGRRFERKFTLADTIVIDNATFENGILAIHMHNELPDHLKSRKINIEGVSKEELLNE